MNTLKSIITLILGTSPFVSYGQEKIALSEMNLDNVYQIYGTPMKDRAVTGSKLMVCGKSYSQGIGVISRSIIKIKLDGKAESFKCIVGVDDNPVDYRSKDITSIPLTDGTMIYYNTDGGKKQFVGVGDGSRNIEKGSVIFQISGDNKELYRSEVKKSGMSPENVEISLKGIKILELEVLDAGDGISGDHANWIDACISYSGEKPETVVSDYKGEIPEMSEEVKANLSTKMKKLSSVSLNFDKEKRDWLIDNTPFKADVYQSGMKDIVLSNGLVSRVFRVYPNLATIDIQNRMTGEKYASCRIE